MLHLTLIILQNAMVPLKTQSWACYANASASSVSWPKGDVALGFNHIDLKNAMVPLMMPSVLCNAYASTIRIIWPKKWCSTSFQMSWPNKCSGAIYDTIGIMWMRADDMTKAKKSYCTSYWCSRAIKCSYAIDNAIGYHMMPMLLPNVSHDTEVVVLMMPLASHDGDDGANGITWSKSHVVSNFDHLDVTNAMLPLMTLFIMWHWHQYQWHHMIKTVMLHIVTIILT